MSQRILYLADTSLWSHLGGDHVARIFPETETLFWNYGDPRPVEPLASWEGDWIISMKNDLVVPGEVLRRARRGAINFHPAPPHYRGLGGYVYALYHRDPAYGITCHHMIDTLDKGSIIRVLRFPLFADDTMSSLRERTGAFCIALLLELLLHIEHERDLLRADETWGEKLFTRKELGAFLERLRAEEPEHRCLL